MQQRGRAAVAPDGVLVGGAAWVELRSHRARFPILDDVFSNLNEPKLEG